MAMEIQLIQGLTLIEEPEAHQHPATIRQIAKTIFASVRKNKQVILTTHSVELIDALLDAATEPDDLEKLSVFWVKLDNGELKTIRTPGEDVAFERDNLGKELR
jgi:AAA15 family ATPase/GTPase